MDVEISSRRQWLHVTGPATLNSQQAAEAQARAEIGASLNDNAHMRLFIGNQVRGATARWSEILSRMN